MDLGIDGETVTMISFSHELWLHLNNGATLAIGSDLVVDGELLTEFASSAPILLARLHSDLKTAKVSRTGVLTLRFADGASWVVGPDANYEAWRLMHRGTTVVSVPGGKVVTWPDGSRYPENSSPRR